MKKKNIAGLLTVCSSALLFSIIPRYTFADSQSTLKPAHDGGTNIAFVDKNDLSQDEQRLIRPIQNGEKVKSCSIYRLVYEKVESAPSFLEKEISKELPNTGSVISWGSFFLGTSLMSAGLFAIVKNRRGKQFLVLLLAGGSLITYGVVSASQTMSEISSRIMIAEGENLEAPAIDQYRFVGIIETEGQCQIISLPPTSSPNTPSFTEEPPTPRIPNTPDPLPTPGTSEYPTLPEHKLGIPLVMDKPILTEEDIPKIPEPPVVQELPELEIPDIPTPPIQPALPSLNIEDIPKIPEPPVVQELPELEIPNIPTPPVQPELPSIEPKDIPDNPPATLEKPIGKISQSRVHVRIETYWKTYNGLVPLRHGNQPDSSNFVDLGEYDVYENIDEVNSKLEKNSDLIPSLVHNTYNIDAMQELRKATGRRYFGGHYIGLVDDSDPTSGSFTEGKDIVIKMMFVAESPQ
jgi:endothelin-converting enzyme 1, metalloprotease family M13, putative